MGERGGRYRQREKKRREKESECEIELNGIEWVEEECKLKGAGKMY